MKYTTEGSNMNKSNKFSPVMVRLLFSVRALNNVLTITISRIVYTPQCQDVSPGSSDCLANA